MSLLDLVKECLKEPYADFICSVIIVSVLREISFNFIVKCDILSHINYIALLILNFNITADNLNLSVFDS